MAGLAPQKLGFAFRNALVKSESRLNDGAAGQALPRFGEYNGSVRAVDDAHQKQGQEHRAQEAGSNLKTIPDAKAGKTASAAPKEITRMKVCNPLNPTKFKTLFKKSRPSMQMVS